jgi:hypothetical protein
MCSSELGSARHQSSPAPPSLHAAGPPLPAIQVAPDCAVQAVWSALAEPQ